MRSSTLYQCYTVTFSLILGHSHVPWLCTQTKLGAGRTKDSLPCPSFFFIRSDRQATRKAIWRDTLTICLLAQKAHRKHVGYSVEKSGRVGTGIQPACGSPAWGKIRQILTITVCYCSGVPGVDPSKSKARNLK